MPGRTYQNYSTDETADRSSSVRVAVYSGPPTSASTPSIPTISSEYFAWAHRAVAKHRDDQVYLPIPQKDYVARNQRSTFQQRADILFFSASGRLGVTVAEVEAGQVYGSLHEWGPYDCVDLGGGSKVMYRLLVYGCDTYSKPKNAQSVVQGQTHNKTRAKIAQDVMNVVRGFIREGRNPAGGGINITEDNVLLLRIRHMSPGTWQPVIARPKSDASWAEGKVRLTDAWRRILPSLDEDIYSTYDLLYICRLCRLRVHIGEKVYEKTLFAEDEAKGSIFYRATIWPHGDDFQEIPCLHTPTSEQMGHEE
ncbi:hypothetical protein NM688_g1491 [Phlebia brevispora]|uniref:Uncharacterized protein n=1 Tax=Phlebia brevispora TaxID=194682 RepID=A0ACC1TBJ1_9APHY|nr:hypothetical protein NM688_g1491 [Phlebia brevispora]